MRTRIWNELGQAKHNDCYCTLLIAHQRRLSNSFNIIILIFSTSGIMGWTFWKEFPFLSCIIISAISLLKLIESNIIPTEKQIDKLCKVNDFYFDYYNKLESLWYDVYHSKIDDEEAKRRFYDLKSSEQTMNTTTGEVIKKISRKLAAKADKETREYLKNNFNATLNA